MTTMTETKTFTTPIHNITFRPYNQLFNRKTMGQLWAKRDSIAEEQRYLIDSLWKQVKKHKMATCEVPMTYSLLSSEVGKRGYGRYYAKTRGSLETLEKSVRGTLCGDYYTDIDVVNCHPTIIVQMAKQFNLSMPYLTKYVENRQQFFDLMNDKLKFNDDMTKEFVIRILYGGRVDKKIVLPDDCDIDMPPEFIGIKKEMTTFSRHLSTMEEHKSFYNWMEKMKEGNLMGSFTSNVLQTVERHILESMVHWLDNNGYKVDVLAYDGCQIRKKEVDLTLIEKAIKEETGYDVKLKIKPFERIEFEEENKEEFIPESIIIDDSFACRKFIELMGEDIVKQDVVYIYNKSGMWETTKEALIGAILRVQEGLIFKQKGQDGKVKTFNYGGSTKHINSMLFHLEALLPKTNAIKLSNSRYCLLFNDGWFDMRDMTFYQGFELCRDKYFTKRISRNFNTTRDNELEKTIKKVLFQNAYNNNNVGEFYKNGISRAIAGLVDDKVWWFMYGNPNCGKGVLTGILKRTFEDYIGMFNMNVLKYNVKDGSDEAKKLSWYVPLIGTRIAIGNEVRIDGKGLDGNMMKTLSGGSTDMIQARQNYENQRDVEITTTFYGGVNDLPIITPCDQALKNRVCIVPHTKSAVDKPQAECNEYEMEADPLLKDKINSKEWIESFFWVIMDSYNGGVRLDKPPEVVAEINEHLVVEDIKIKELLEAKYQFVPTDEEVPSINCVTSREVISYLNEEGFKLSDVKVAKELKKIGLVQSRKKMDGRTIVVWNGLRQ